MHVTSLKGLEMAGSLGPGACRPASLENSRGVRGPASGLLKKKIKKTKRWELTPGVNFCLPQYAYRHLHTYVFPTCHFECCCLRLRVS